MRVGEALQQKMHRESHNANGGERRCKIESPLSSKASAADVGEGEGPPRTEEEAPARRGRRRWLWPRPPWPGGRGGWGRPGGGDDTKRGGGSCGGTEISGEDQLPARKVEVAMAVAAMVERKRRLGPTTRRLPSPTDVGLHPTAVDASIPLRHHALQLLVHLHLRGHRVRCPVAVAAVAFGGLLRLEPVGWLCDCSSCSSAIAFLLLEPVGLICDCSAVRNGCKNAIAPPLLESVG
jgi:hypothetical protein